MKSKMQLVAMSLALAVVSLVAAPRKDLEAAVGWGSRRGVVLLVFLAIIGFFLFTEHRAHLFGILPYLLLLACPFMHFFMQWRSRQTRQ